MTKLIAPSFQKLERVFFLCFYIDTHYVYKNYITANIKNANSTRFLAGFFSIRIRCKSDVTTFINLHVILGIHINLIVICVFTFLPIMVKTYNRSGYIFVIFFILSKKEQYTICNLHFLFMKMNFPRRKQKFISIEI